MSALPVFKLFHIHARSRFRQSLIPLLLKVISPDIPLQRVLINLYVLHRLLHLLVIQNNHKLTDVRRKISLAA